eukprot:CAMPEP_0167747848 /NCGR_PEP_ID=MMETSP0110_2-20121227/4512_1 /TAXON_ID=629695 /ORGANISM="Gymnochlora sp., Strain CCMP2014" /LENGTH=310 /DNA_ID=CAMNT_0007632801 /DNA_START=17 /DNA_END=946 /DNA_ORIENTATION=+
MACLLSFASIVRSVTVSGFSSGAFMAVQHHVAFSEAVRGVGVIAGGPYWCAQDNLEIALTTCMTVPDLIVLDELYAATEYAYATNTIDNPDFIKEAAIYLLAGAQDSTVIPKVVQKLQEYYEFYLGPERAQAQLVTKYDLPAEHTYPTLGYGNACDYNGRPYISNCGFDAAGTILSHLYSTAYNYTLLAPKNESSKADNLIEIKTSKYLPPYVPIPAAIALHDIQYAYVPSSCKLTSCEDEKCFKKDLTAGPCPIHVAYHGCTQTIPNIGKVFVENTGYLPWAEKNGIIVLFPQAIETTVPYNPKGCWDW